MIRRHCQVCLATAAFVISMIDFIEAAEGEVNHVDQE